MENNFSRKRNKSEEDWKRNVSKRKRNSGESYTSASGRVIQAKIFTATVSCLTLVNNAIRSYMGNVCNKVPSGYPLVYRCIKLIIFCLTHFYHHLHTDDCHRQTFIQSFIQSVFRFQGEVCKCKEEKTNSLSCAEITDEEK